MNGKKAKAQRKLGAGQGFLRQLRKKAKLERRTQDSSPRKAFTPLMHVQAVSKARFPLHPPVEHPVRQRIDELRMELVTQSDPPLSLFKRVQRLTNASRWIGKFPKQQLLMMLRMA